MVVGADDFHAFVCPKGCGPKTDKHDSNARALKDAINAYCREGEGSAKERQVVGSGTFIKEADVVMFVGARTFWLEVAVEGSGTIEALMAGSDRKDGVAASLLVQGKQSEWSRIGSETEREEKLVVFGMEDGGRFTELAAKLIEPSPLDMFPPPPRPPLLCAVGFQSTSLASVLVLQAV